MQKRRERMHGRYRVGRSAAGAGVANAVAQ